MRGPYPTVLELGVQVVLVPPLTLRVLAKLLLHPGLESADIMRGPRHLSELGLEPHVLHAVGQARVPSAPHAGVHLLQRPRVVVHGDVDVPVVPLGHAVVVLLASALVLVVIALAVLVGLIPVVGLPSQLPLELPLVLLLVTPERASFSRSRCSRHCTF